MCVKSCLCNTCYNIKTCTDCFFIDKYKNIKCNEKGVIQCDFYVERGMKMNDIFGTETLEEMSRRNRALAEVGNHSNIICPAIYRHFKHSVDGKLNNYMYTTIGISTPMKVKDFPEDIYRYTMMETINTETNKLLIIHFINDSIYHPEENCKDKLVIYKSLYDGSRPYARPFDMFASEVDKEKYPSIKQKYRFEIVRY